MWQQPSRRMVTRSAIVCGAGLLLAGCFGPAPRPLTADAFLERKEVDGTGRVQPVDQPGALLYGTRADADDIDTPPPVERRRNPRGAAGGRVGAGQPLQPVPDVVQQAVRPPSEAGFQGVDTTPPPETENGNGGTGNQPPAQAGGDPEDLSGKHWTLGAVLAQVNGRPIFADKVLSTLDSALATEARRRTAQAFQTVAAELINAQIEEFIADELEFAAAQRNLDARYETKARALATQWQLEQITKAGGSEELARRKWEAEGQDFDDRVEEEYRTIMRRMYLSLKERPLVQVRQRDIRAYYEANKAKEFTRRDAARFRVIKIGIDPEAAGDGHPAVGATRAEALRKAQTLHRRATAGGEDFDKLAATNNAEPAYKQPFDGPIERGAFRVDAVEEAVWNLAQPGDVTDVIEGKNEAGRTEAFYIAKLQERNKGRVVPFEEAQTVIERKLRAEQLMMVRAKALRALRQDAIISRDRRRIQTALEMAMQKYPQWAAAK